MAERLEPIEPDTVDFNVAAARLGISRSTAWRLDKAGQFPIPVIRLGSVKKVSKAALERILSGEQVAS